MGRRNARIASWHAFALMSLIPAGCTSQTAEVPDTEQMRAAAGFRATLAMTPQEQRQLSALPPLRVMMQSGGSGTRQG